MSGHLIVPDSPWYRRDADGETHRWQLQWDPRSSAPDTDELFESVIWNTAKPKTQTTWLMCTSPASRHLSHAVTPTWCDGRSPACGRLKPPAKGRSLASRNCSPRRSAAALVGLRRLRAMSPTAPSSPSRARRDLFWRVAELLVARSTGACPATLAERSRAVTPHVPMPRPRYNWPFGEDQAEHRYVVEDIATACGLCANSLSVRSSIARDFRAVLTLEPELRSAH